MSGYACARCGAAPHPGPCHPRAHYAPGVVALVALVVLVALVAALVAAPVR